ncbi:hypothetical protein IIB50_00070 [Patescibacteria group bacterium]|nr:hypothetical protein [Patescibacteria group bacterium]
MQINTLGDLIYVITDILQAIVPVLIALALLYFFWGMANFLILHADSEVEREKGRSVMFWGIITFFVMVSVWGILHMLEATFF